MTKQKVVLKLSMEDAKRRAKAMQCAVGLLGVVSASHDGDKMTVVGEGIDSVALTTLLRKKMGYAELVTVTAIEEKKEETKEKKEETKAIKVEENVKSSTLPLISSYYYDRPAVAMTQPSYYYADVREPSYDQINCSIM